MLSTLALVSLLAAGDRVVAIHYFDNRTGDAELDVLCKGVADMLVTDLVGVPGLSIVEREKLEAVLQELKLQRTQWFDPKSAQQVGKLLGASVVVTGQFVEVKPTLAIDARALDVATGKVVATARVKGPAADFFALELELANALAGGLVKGAKATAQGPADTATVLEYARALDEKDKGDVAAASRRMGQVVRAAPDFRLGKKRHAELIEFLAKATSANDDALAKVRRELEARLARGVADDLGFSRVCADVLLAALTVSDLRTSVGAGLSETGTNVLTRRERAKSAKHLDRLMALSADLLDSAPRHVSGTDTSCGDWRDRADLTRLGVKHPGVVNLLPPQLLDAHLRLLAFGQTPAWAGASFRVAPAPAIANPELAKVVDKWVDVYRATLLETVKRTRLPEESAMGDWTEMAGQIDVLFGRPDAAVEKWQLFLTKYPGSKAWGRIKRKLELMLGTTPEAEDFAKGLGACKAELVPLMSKEVQRVGWVEGPKGLERLTSKVEPACREKREALVAFYTALVAEAAFWNECALLQSSERKLAALQPETSHEVFLELCAE
ncbi:MAG: hypothetical protein JNK82_38445 [Myxococcaceae bacterium]|nr:hypothetical protein [Myxococcaceae bacterium]